MRIAVCSNVNTHHHQRLIALSACVTDLDTHFVGKLIWIEYHTHNMVGNGSGSGSGSQQRNPLEINNTENGNAFMFRNENKWVSECANGWMKTEGQRGHTQKPCLFVYTNVKTAQFLGNWNMALLCTVYTQTHFDVEQKMQKKIQPK